jgi:hypothetical protein
MKKEKEEEEEVLFYMPKSLKTEIRIIAAREGKSIKEIMNEISAEYAKGHKEGNDQHLITSFQEDEDMVGYPSMATSYDKKKAYVKKHCQEDGKLTDFGKILFGHISQWHSVLMKY